MTASPAPRRLASVALLFGTAVLVLVAPVLFAATFIADVVTSPRRLRLSRLLAMAYCYLLLEAAGVALAVALWIGTGFGIFMSSRRSRRAHYRVQRWWARSVFRAAEQCLGLRVEFDGVNLIGNTPAIVAAQHASFFDALLPTLLLAERTDRAARHVLKRELAWDPCLGLFGHRHPNHFVTREPDDASLELAAIERLAATAGPEALVIFPEGTFHTDARAAKVHARLAAEAPQRHARLQLEHLLPPRPGGLLALLRGRPDSDLIFLAHSGLEPFGSFRAIMREVPFTNPVKAKIWRLAADELPEDPDAQLAMIDRVWQTMDDWVGATSPSVPADHV